SGGDVLSHSDGATADAAIPFGISAHLGQNGVRRATRRAGSRDNEVRFSMQPLRYGAEGAAVADVRRVLAVLGLLANLDPSTERTFDTSAELAVRHYQQRRGLSV